MIFTSAGVLAGKCTLNSQINQSINLGFRAIESPWNDSPSSNPELLNYLDQTIDNIQDNIEQ